MNKKLFVSVFLCSFIFSLLLLCQEESEEKKIWEDERIGITLDEMEWTDTWPSELPSEGVDRIRKNWHLFIIYLTVVHVKDIEMYPPELDLEYSIWRRRQIIPESLSQKLHLIDSEGLIYEVMLVEFKTPLRSSKRDFTMYYSSDQKVQFELYPGAKGCLVFSLPKDRDPVKLVFVYPYKGEPPKPKKKKYGQIEIDLLHIQ